MEQKGLEAGDELRSCDEGNELRSHDGGNALRSCLMKIQIKYNMF